MFSSNLVIPFFLLEALLLGGGFLLVRRIYLATRIYKSKRHLEAAFDSIEDPLAIIRRDYTIVRVNHAYSTMVEKRFPDILEHKCYEVLRNRNEPCEDCQMRLTLRTERKQFTPSSTHPRAPHRRAISLTFYPFRPKRGADYSVVEHIRDITELEFLKDSLEKRNKALSDTTLVLRRAQAEMNDELALARQVQRSTLPQRSPQFDGLQIGLTYHPIEAVGGDVYDFVQFSDTKLAIFIGDASGHGLPSAFVSTISKMSFYNNTREEVAPARLLDRLNQDLLGNIRTTHYLTSVVAVFDTSDNSITYARAGHPMPVVVRKTGEVFCLGGAGTFVGILDNALYEQRKFYLKKGDRCYLCTDGIYEVMDPEQNTPGVLGFKRFVEIISSVNHRSFDEIIPAIKTELAPFKYEDDYTLMVIEITGECDIDTSEILPGFNTNKDLAFIAFNSMEEAAKQTETLLGAMSKKKYMAEDVQRMRLCVNELLSNALEHGNGNKPDGRVSMAYSLDESEVRLCVVDKGSGFNLHMLPDPTTGEHLHKEGGRGLYLVRQYVDEIGQNRRGNGIYIVKRRNAS